MPEHEWVNCPRCSGLFNCRPGHVAHCQCSTISLAETVREYIALHYSGCLCINCLQQLQAAAQQQYPQQESSL